MKSALRPIHVLFFLFEICVFGNAETVSVIEGDSVTLHTGVTEIQRDDVIEWRMLNGSRIAKITGGDPSRSDGVFRDGLKLNKTTGDLKITNIKTTDSGEYILKITRNKGGPTEKTFSVSVVSDDKKPSVLLGEYVTLPTGVTTQIYDEIQWRFGDKKIAQVNRNTRNVSCDLDERFRDRLQLDYWTGSLTIINTRPEHTGVYEVDIIRISKYTIHKTFTVTVRGKIQSVSVNEGESITLQTGTVLQAHDTALWEFGDTVIVAFYNNITNVGLDERFTDRLELDKKTGYLTIMKTRITDSGEYNVKISSKQVIQKKFIVTVTGSHLSSGVIVLIFIASVVCVAAVAVGVTYNYSKTRLLKNVTCEEESLEVEENKDVILKTGATKVKRKDMILWIFVEQDEMHLIAQMNGLIRTSSIYNGRFGDRLKLDETGSLTIMNITTEDAGVYHLKMKIGRKCLFKSFKITVRR